MSAALSLSALLCVLLTASRRLPCFLIQNQEVLSLLACPVARPRSARLARLCPSALAPSARGCVRSGEVLEARGDSPCSPPGCPGKPPGRARTMPDSSSSLARVTLRSWSPKVPRRRPVRWGVCARADALVSACEVPLRRQWFLPGLTVLSAAGSRGLRLPSRLQPCTLFPLHLPLLGPWPLLAGNSVWSLQAAERVSEPQGCSSGDSRRVCRATAAGP